MFIARLKLETTLRIVLLGLFFGLTTSIYSQDLPFSGSKNKKAEFQFSLALQQFQLGDYPKSLNYLDKAVTYDPAFIDAWMLIAKVHSNNENYKKSGEIYEKVKLLNPEFTMSYLELASDALKTGDYEKCSNNINAFLARPDYYKGKKRIAEKLKATVEFVSNATKNPVKFDPYNLGPGVNTFENEYFPGITADEQTLIFTRLVRNSNEEFFVSKKVDGVWDKAKNLGEPINTENNEGTVSLSADGQYIFYTACNRESGMGSCDLLLSRLDGDKWLDPVLLNPPVNGRSWESQPSISFDGKTLYFTSERPGGFGKSDIWYTTYKGGRWTPPINMGPEINTEGNEQSPFIAKDDNTLYFNSDGHPGMGGIDLFYSRRGNDGRWGPAKNLGFPINTPNDETCIIIASNGIDAYMAADRENGMGGLDIWGFQLYEEARPQKTGYVKGIVFNAVTKAKIAAKIQLIELSTGKIMVESYSNKLSGEFLVCLQGNKNYALNVSAEGYMFYSENFSLKNQIATDPLILNVPLSPISVGSKIVLKNLFFDVDRFNLKPESKVELDKLLQFMTSNPKIRIEISGHTDNTGDKQKNIDLSQNRAKEVYNYLVQNNIPAARLTFKGYADNQPIADNNTSEGKALNRRTEMKIIQ